MKWCKNGTYIWNSFFKKLLIHFNRRKAKGEQELAHVTNALTPGSRQSAVTFSAPWEVSWLCSCSLPPHLLGNHCHESRSPLWGALNPRQTQTVWFPPRCTSWPLRYRNDQVLCMFCKLSPPPYVSVGLCLFTFEFSFQTQYQNTVDL